ncbi:disulfide bond formation protein DsbB [Endozoicomonadaceae bacterium StTr2]
MNALATLWADFRSAPLTAIQNWQNYRITWLIMLLTAVFLESTAWYFQYVMYLDPCELCVYQRLAVMLLAISAAVMMIAPRNRVIRSIGYLIWIVGAVYGLKVAMKQLGYYGADGMFVTCNALPTFPFNLPLYDWWPDMFFPTGFCGEDGWSLLGMNMAQWMTVIFSVYIAAFALCVISLFKKK